MARYVILPRLYGPQDIEHTSYLIKSVIIKRMRIPVEKFLFYPVNLAHWFSLQANNLILII